MAADDVADLLELFGDIARIEADVGELAGQLEILGQNDLLLGKVGKAGDGIARLSMTLAMMEVGLAGARSQISETLVARRSDLPEIEAVLTLYRDVTRAELDVGELSETLQRARTHRSVQDDGELVALREVFDRVHERLEQDRGILHHIEDTLNQVIVG